MISKLCLTNVLRSILMVGFLSSVVVSPAFSVEADDSAVFLSGFTAYHKQDYSKAIENLNELLKKYPQSQMRDMAIFWLARSYFKNGNYREAARNMSQFASEYPENPLRATVEAELLALTDRYDKGERLPEDEVKGGEQIQPQQVKPESDLIAQEQAEKERIIAKKAEEARLAHEAAAKQAEKDRIIAMMVQMDRSASERVTKEKLAKEQAAREQLSRQQAEKERVAKRQADQERLANEKGDQGALTAYVPLSPQQTEQERSAKRQAEQERLAAEQAEKERVAREKAELGPLAAEQAERERVARVKAEQDRVAAEQKKRAAFQSGQPLVATKVEAPQPTSPLLPTAKAAPLPVPSPDKHDVKHISALEDQPTYALVVAESSVLAQLDPVVTKLSSAHYQPVITSRRSDSEAYLLAVGCYGDREAALRKKDNLVNQGEQASVVKSDALYCAATKTFVTENKAKEELDRLEAHGVKGVKVIKVVTSQNSWVLSIGHFSTIRAAVEASLALGRVGIAATIVKSSELGE